jgi:hypothetical protein
MQISSNVQKSLFFFFFFQSTRAKKGSSVKSVETLITKILHGRNYFYTAGTMEILGHDFFFGQTFFTIHYVYNGKCRVELFSVKPFFNVHFLCRVELFSVKPFFNIHFLCRVELFLKVSLSQLTHPYQQ